MALPKFDSQHFNSASEICSQVADRVRFERRRQKRSQSAFAEACGVPVRTFKRFELGECDSLEVFIRIVMEFNRTAGLELLFPPSVSVAESRQPIAALERLMSKVAPLA